MKALRLVLSIVLICVLGACEQEPPAPAGDGTSVFFDPGLKPFYHGVASGDPLPDRVVIWTRITPDQPGAVEVDWTLARDEAFTEAVQTGTVSTEAARDYTVKVDVTGLDPGTHYYYRFVVDAQTSLIGRTKTAPVDANQAVRLAVVSCSNYEAGYFNAYARLAEKDDLDAVVHLGDYIYEYEPDRYGDKSLDRKHLPPREIISLQDYRTRYAQYRLDADLRKAHQMHPFVTIWDDHEISNNSYASGAQNHQPEEGDYATRKAVAQQVYYEWMPVRERTDQQLYRSFSFGPLVNLVMLDERLAGRTAPVDSVTQATYRDADRSMLGAEQYAWLTDQLSSSEAVWKVIGNQVIFSDLDFSSTSSSGRTRNLDAWDGYPYEKERIIGFLEDQQIEDVIILSGDTHSSWAFEVPGRRTAYDAETGGGAVAVEFGTPSISSANYDESLPSDSVRVLEGLLQAPEANPHLKYVNMRQHGYFILTLSTEAAEAAWYYVDRLNAPSPNETLSTTYRVQVGSHRLGQ